MLLCWQMLDGRMRVQLSAAGCLSAKVLTEGCCCCLLLDRRNGRSRQSVRA